jgi:heme/copper-type cytochrome/quinol oxidase subunit 3
MPEIVPSGKLGMWLFLASEIMFFATLFTSYIVYRIAAPEWPRGWEVLNVRMGTINTFILIVSSVTMVLAFAKTIERDRKGFVRYLALTILLGLVFLVIKGFEYNAKFTHGIYPATSIFYAIYFTITGLHGLHVLIGIGINATLLWLSRKQWDKPFFAGRIEAAGLFWHFVDIVWIFVFPSIYLI